MARPYSELRKKMSPGARDRAQAKAQTLLKEMPLWELRKAMSLSQEQLAKEIHVKQAAVSKLERRTDMYISTLRKVIEAMGGSLDIVARFPKGDVKINQFKEIDPSSLAETK